MPDTSRRDVLAGAAALAAGPMLTLPAAASGATPLAFQPSALLLEHRRRIVPVLALEAMDPLEDLYALDAAGLLPHTMTSEEIEAITDPPQARHQARIDAHLRPLATIARAIWATPAATWADIVTRAELAKFWNRGGLGYAEYHGYDDCHAEMRLIDAVLVVADRRREMRDGLPPFDPPPALVAWRRLDQEVAALLAVREWTQDEHFAHIDRQWRLERPLLKEPADSSSWSDVVVRAELTSWRRRNMFNTWAHFDDDDIGKALPHRSFAELMLAILQLGNCPPPADVDEISWQREARQGKSRERHAEVKALRKDWRNRAAA